ncbi:MAG: hypothetical protein IJZ62_04365 [Clostridia bacterium]|nr:hypothetical protein [Clostridia bacterium]
MKEKITEFYGVATNKFIDNEKLSKTLADLYAYNVVKYALLIEHVGNTGDKHIHFYIIFSGFRKMDNLIYLFGDKVNMYDISHSFEFLRNYLLEFNSGLTFEIGFRGNNKKD